MAALLWEGRDESNRLGERMEKQWAWLPKTTNMAVSLLPPSPSRWIGHNFSIHQKMQHKQNILSRWNKSRTMTTSEADNNMENESQKKNMYACTCAPSATSTTTSTSWWKRPDNSRQPYLEEWQERKLDFLRCLEIQRVVRSPQLAVRLSYTIQLECGHNGNDTAPYQSKLYYW